MKKIIRKVKFRINSLTSRYDRDNFSSIEYWEKRAKRLGERSVLNIKYSSDEIEEATKKQKDKLLPLFSQQLLGNEQIILDFGCGPGRFTSDLAGFSQNLTLGVDPIKTLISLAPKNNYLRYLVFEPGTLPIKSNSIDVTWICLVLGGIVDDLLLEYTVNEIGRILKKNGLVFLVENTSKKPDHNHWKYRNVQTYIDLFDFAKLKYLSNYTEVDGTISVIAGRKHG